MKRFFELVAPAILFVLGGLVLLEHLNLLKMEGTDLVRGIFATIMGAYYIGLGVVSLFFKERLSYKVFDILTLVSLCFYPAFIFTSNIILFVDIHEIIGPSGWIIGIAALASSLGLIVTAILAKVRGITLVIRLKYLFGMVFVLVLVLGIVFDNIGDSIRLGNIPLGELFITITYSFFLFKVLSNDVEVKESSEE